jgi:hypothetical protein
MAIYPATWSSTSSSRERSERAVYVVGAGLTSFAFEARSLADAEDLVRSHGFARALDRFCSQKFGASRSTDRPRAATAREAAVFQEVAAEFADAAGRFLVVHLR